MAATRKSTTVILIVFILVPVLGLAGFRTLFRKVPIDRVGVRTSLLFGAGIDQEDYPPGFVFVAPLQHKLDLMDPTYQKLTLAGNSAYKLRLKDGFQTTVDVTIVYRLKPGQAHRAIERHGPGSAFQKKLKSIADKYIWDVLTELYTEDFYNTEKRTEKAEKALELVNQELADEYIDVTAILIRDILFDEGFEEKLRELQKIDQEKLLFGSQKKLEDEKKITELIERDTANEVVKLREEQSRDIKALVAGTDAEIAKIKADADKTAATMIAQARSTSRALIAEGELARVAARAEGEKAINDAYALPGGDLYIAKQIVENVQFGSIEINTTKTNPFDVGQMLEMIGVSAAAIDGHATRPASGE